MKTKHLIGIGIVGLGAMVATPVHAGLSIGISLNLPLPPLPVIVAPAPRPSPAPSVVYAPVPACPTRPVAVRPPIPVFGPPTVVVAPTPVWRPVLWMPPGQAKKYDGHHGKPGAWNHKASGKSWQHGRDRQQAGPH